MRILVVNSNTSAIVTEKVMAEAQAIAAPGTEIVARDRHLRRARHRHARRARHRRALDDRARRAACGAAATPWSSPCPTTPALRGARELLSIPVVGMTEAGLLTACMLGGRIGVITFGRRVLPLYQRAGGELRSRRAASPAGACWKAPRRMAAASIRELDREIVATAHDLVERDVAETIVAHRRRDGRRSARIQPAFRCR